MDPELKAYLDAWQAREQRVFDDYMARMDAHFRSMQDIAGCGTGPVTASSDATELAIASVGLVEPSAPIPAIREPLAVAPAVPTATITVVPTSYSTECAAQAITASITTTLLPWASMSSSSPATSATNGVLSTELALDNDADEHGASLASYSLSSSPTQYTAWEDASPTAPTPTEVSDTQLLRPFPVQVLSPLAPANCSTECYDIRVVDLTNLYMAMSHEVDKSEVLGTISTNCDGPALVFQLRSSRPEASIIVQSAVNTVLLCNDTEEVLACVLSDEVLQQEEVQQQPWPPPELEVLCSFDIHSLQLTNALFEVPITAIPMKVFVTCSVLEVNQSGYASSFLMNYLVKEESQRAPCLCVILDAIPYGPDHFRWEIAWVLIVSSCGRTKFGGSVNITKSDSVSSTDKWWLWRYNSFSHWTCFGVAWWNDIILQDWLIAWSIGHSTQCRFELFQWMITGSGCCEIASTEFKTRLLPNVVSSVPVDGQTRPADVCIAELGGTVGGMEIMPLIEALRQLSFSLVVKALLHSSVACSLRSSMHWVAASDLEDAATTSAPHAHTTALKTLKCSSCIFVPAKFGDRGISRLICAAKYAGENKVLHLGIFLGMQLSVIEVSRHVLGLEEAGTATNTPDRVILYLPKVPVIIDPELWSQTDKTIRLIWSSKLTELIRVCEQGSNFPMSSHVLLSVWIHVKCTQWSWDPGGSMFALCSSDKRWTTTLHHNEQLQWSSLRLACAFQIWLVAGTVFGLKFFTGCGQAPFQGRRVVIQAVFSDQVHISHDYDIVFFNPIPIYYDYYLEQAYYFDTMGSDLIYHHENCRGDCSKTKGAHMPWDPGKVSPSLSLEASAWGQAEFQGGRDVRTLTVYPMLGCRHGLAQMGRAQSLASVLIHGRRQRKGASKMDQELAPAALLPPT